MIRSCTDNDFDTIRAIINEAAEAYRGIIPADRWADPYMTADHLRDEIAAGIGFSGYEVDGELTGVMGVQPVKDVTLIRHAYVRTAQQRGGVGAALLAAAREATDRPVLIGTWAAADWAVAFYQKHGFGLITGAEKDRLLQTYWSIPVRQVETSVVLADTTWFEHQEGGGRQ